MFKTYAEQFIAILKLKRVFVTSQIRLQLPFSLNITNQPKCKVQNVF